MPLDLFVISPPLRALSRVTVKAVPELSFFFLRRELRCCVHDIGGIEDGEPSGTGFMVAV